MGLKMGFMINNNIGLKNDYTDGSSHQRNSLNNGPRKMDLEQQIVKPKHMKENMEVKNDDHLRETHDLDSEDDLLTIANKLSQQDKNKGTSTSKRYKEKIISTPTTLDPEKQTAVALAPSEWRFKNGTRLTRKKQTHRDYLALLEKLEGEQYGTPGDALHDTDRSMEESD